MSIQMTPKQRRKANALIRKSCCNYDGGNCIALDDGEPCVCVRNAGSLNNEFDEYGNPLS